MCNSENTDNSVRQARRIKRREKHMGRGACIYFRGSSIQLQPGEKIFCLKNSDGQSIR